LPNQKKKFRPTETPIIVAVKKLLAQSADHVEKRLADLAGYLTGALEQLMFQQGQMMTVQAAIIEYLNEHLAPGSEATIRSIMETNIAKAKAERDAREKQLSEEAEKRKADAIVAEHARIMNAAACPACGAPAGSNCDSEDPAANHCPGRVTAANEAEAENLNGPDNERNAIPDGETPDFGDGPYDPTAPVNIAAHAKAKREKTGAYAEEAPPANIAPEAPVDAPADPPGSA
jgi:hypothetical protein